MSLFSTNRELRCWEYTVSLRQLLLRSPKGETGEATNLDIIFLGVRFIQMPTGFKGLTISKGGDTHVELVERAVGAPVKPNRVFVLTTERREFLILAATMRVEENTLDLRETSVEFSPSEARTHRPAV